MTPQERITLEAKRVARGMWKALGSARLPQEIVSASRQAVVNGDHD